MSDIIILPGIGNSGATHWQTIWEIGDARMTRFHPSDWDRPELEDWIDALDRAIEQATRPPLLIAHSLACLLVAHWATHWATHGATGRPHPVRGAFLVAVPDPASPVFPTEAASFANPPAARLPFPSLVVASSNDPYGTLAHARASADIWGSQLVEAGAHGHLNGASGLGAWPEGNAALAAFEESLAPQAIF